MTVEEIDRERAVQHAVAAVAGGGGIRAHRPSRSSTRMSRSFDIAGTPLFRHACARRRELVHGGINEFHEQRNEEAERHDHLQVSLGRRCERNHQQQPDRERLP